MTDHAYLRYRFGSSHLASTIALPVLPALPAVAESTPDIILDAGPAQDALPPVEHWLHHWPTSCSTVRRRLSVPNTAS